MGKVKVRLIIALGAIYITLAPIQVSAKDGERLSNFKQLCVSNQGAGFNWSNGGWQHALFESSRYIVKKITPPKTRQEAKQKDMLMAYVNCVVLAKGTEDKDYGDVKHLNSCIAIQKTGNALATFELCNERHVQSKDGNNWRVDFQCPSKIFFFEPNGWFHSGSVLADVERQPKDDYKDSLVIEVGKCADISD